MQRSSYVLLAALFLLPASASQAQYSGIVGSDAADVLVGVAAVGYGLFTLGGLGFEVASLVSYAKDRPFHPGLVVGEFVLSTLHTVFGLCVIIGGASSADHAAAWVSGGAAHVVLGGSLIAHGVWSLVERDRSPPFAVAIDPTGASLSFVTDFEELVRR